MSIIIREKEYIVVPKDPTNGELGPALDTINSNTKSDIGSETKKALAHYLSDATLGKVKNITKSKFGVYDDSIVLNFNLLDTLGNISEAPIGYSFFWTNNIRHKNCNLSWCIKFSSTLTRTLCKLSK